MTIRDQIEKQLENVEQTKKFFFYGTLNNDRPGAVRVEGCIVKGFALWTFVPRGWYPCAIESSKKSRVHGGLFDYAQLSDKDFREAVWGMDSYEGCPGLYTRILVEVILPDRTITKAWMYRFNNPEKRKLQRKWGGDWKLPNRNRTAYVNHQPDGSQVWVGYHEYKPTAKGIVGNHFSLTLDVDEAYSADTRKLWKLIELWCLQHGAWYIHDEESEPSKWRIRVSKSQSEVHTICPKKSKLQSQKAGAGVGTEMCRSNTQGAPA
jgi:gamma-glutamylcyclotransferase (GGCT)/AIG2-like uncharacterized protein YtfP